MNIFCRNWKGIEIHEELDPVTHSQFTNDTMLFREAFIREAQVIRDTLDLYSMMSGQTMSKDKLEIEYQQRNAKKG